MLPYLLSFSIFLGPTPIYKASLEVEGDEQCKALLASLEEAIPAGTTFRGTCKLIVRI